MPYRSGRTISILLLAILFLATALLSQSTPPNSSVEFISFEAAKPILDKMPSALPAPLKDVHSLDAAAWNAWVKSEDADIRQRLQRGEEDTLTNLLRFGVTFTKEFRIDREYLSSYGQSTLVNAFAENRANDLLRALRSPSANPGMQEMRSFLQRKGYSLETPAGRDGAKKYLLANLARMRDEFNAYREKIKTSGEAELSELYSDRGISLDTNLWPDYDLGQQFEKLLAADILQPGSIRRIAVVGPGLDFANKEAGNDYYAPQTTQPFAVLDSLLRLKVADPGFLELKTLDISPLVNIHVQRIHKAALLRQPCTVQLTWNSSVPRSPEYLAGFTSYWRAWGSQIGTPVPPIPPPAATAKELRVRAVKIRSDVVARVTPLDMNVVLQRVPLPDDQRFDLIIGTNIFIYYDAFEQSLARANLSFLLRPGGLLLTNELLADAVILKLPELSRTSITLSTDPPISQVIYCYRRER